MDMFGKKMNLTVVLLSFALICSVIIIICLVLLNFRLLNQGIACAPCPIADGIPGQKFGPLPAPDSFPGFDGQYPGNIVSSPGSAEPLPVPSNLPPSPSKYTCPESGWIDCMPTVGPNKRSYGCAQEVIAWYRENCPDFEGVAY